MRNFCVGYADDKKTNGLRSSTQPIIFWTIRIRPTERDTIIPNYEFRTSISPAYFFFI